MVKKIKTIEQGLKHAELSLNKVLNEIQSLNDLSKYKTFKSKVEHFSEELSCYLFFDKFIDQLDEDVNAKNGLREVTKEVSSFLIKIGSLYVKITDFDEDGKPLLDISKVQFTETNGKYTLSLDDAIDHDDVNLVQNKLTSYTDMIKNGSSPTDAAMSVAVDSILVITAYSMKINKEIEKLKVEKVFTDIFNSLKRYPNAFKTSFKFNTIAAMAASLVFSGIMLFIWIGISKIKDVQLKDTMETILNNDFVKAQITTTVKLITDAITGENVKGQKLCGCIPLCCRSSIDVIDVNDNLQDDLDKLIAQTETDETKKSKTLSTSPLVLTIPSSSSLDKELSPVVPAPPGQHSALMISPIPVNLNVDVSVTDNEVTEIVDANIPRVSTPIPLPARLSVQSPVPSPIHLSDDVNIETNDEPIINSAVDTIEPVVERES